MIELDACINQVKQLPPSPELLPKLLDLLGQPNIDGDAIVRLITYDPALTVNVVRLCNSASLGSATPVVKLDEAVVRLGFDQIYRMVAAVSVAKTLRPKRENRSGSEIGLWKHSVASAVAAKLIAQDLGDDPNLVFTATLLHDIGKVILAEAFNDGYAKLVEEVEQNQYSLLESEKRTFGVQHAEIGGRLLARWKFPLNLATGVCFHHHPASARPYERMASYLYLGNLIGHLLGYGCERQALNLVGRADALEILKLDAGGLPRYMLGAQAEFKNVQSLFQIGA
jgi:putative nucleotidyltransferase with HDIG domain